MCCVHRTYWFQADSEAWRTILVFCENGSSKWCFVDSGLGYNRYASAATPGCGGPAIPASEPFSWHLENRSTRRTAARDTPTLGADRVNPQGDPDLIKTLESSSRRP